MVKFKLQVVSELKISWLKKNEDEINIIFNKKYYVLYKSDYNYSQVY